MTDVTRSQHRVPRGRHAPPLEIRLEAQQQRLFDAAAIVERLIFGLLSQPHE